MVSAINQINSDSVDSDSKIENKRSLIDKYIKYTNNLSGASRAIEVVGKVAGLGDSIQPSVLLKRVYEGAGTALASFGLIRIPVITKKAIQAIWAITQDDGIDLYRKVAEAVKKIIQMLAEWASAIILLTPLAPLRVITSGAFLTVELADLTESVSDYSKASGLSKTAKGEIQEAVDHSRNYYFYRSFKNIVAIANGIFSLLGLALGLTFLPAVAAAILSLCVTLLAINADFYKESGRYSIIKFDHPFCA